jgi:hypothetical protein
LPGKSRGFAKFAFVILDKELADNLFKMTNANFKKSIDFFVLCGIMVSRLRGKSPKPKAVGEGWYAAPIGVQSRGQPRRGDAESPSTLLLLDV